MHRAHILDLLPIGIAVLDPRARIRYSNRCLSGLLRSSNEIAINDGILSVRSSAHNRVFSEALSQLASGSADGPIGFTIARSKLHPLSVVLTALRPGHPSPPVPSGKRIVALLCDPDFPIQPPIPLLKQLFDFTPMEAAVASLMLQFRDTRTIAGELAISHETVRKHLKAMFAKTHCRNQAELLHVLLFNPAILLFSTDQYHLSLPMIQRIHGT